VVRLTNDVLLAGRELMVLLQVVVKLLEICAKVLDRAGGRDEAVHSHGSVISSPQVPGLASQRDCGSDLADGVDVSESSQPTTQMLAF